ncbi:hypothetical protein PsorP6_011553 [Peronosclerospora sorghi]|uniref:Uncharacterized protein n=1 Tax=Peronosclerospora sorghi TaxID=230839 RepID=A0ACC0WHG1_9STRA|nr:hypothetical protein PsorP6_011553 [Peronosclerospora sorghi]
MPLGDESEFMLGANMVKYVTFSAGVEILVSDKRIKCLIEWGDGNERHKPSDLANESTTLVLKVRGVGKGGGRAASPLRKTGVLCRRGRAHFELADYVQEREAFDAFYRVEPHRMEGLDVYSTTLLHLKKAVELSYVRSNLPLDSQHEAPRRQTRVTGGCLLEMKQSLCLAHLIKYVTFSAEAKILVSDNRIKCLI